MGNTAGFVDGSYLFEIDGVQLGYSLDSGEIYYLPNDQELTFDILDSDVPYELYLLIPHSDIIKIINVIGESGGDTVELNEENNILIISNPTTIEPLFPGIQVNSGEMPEIPTTTPFFVWQSDAELFNFYLYRA